MKKIIALMLALPLALGLIGCSGGSENNADADVAYESSVAILSATWDALDESARFAAFGGDFENAVSDAPAAHSLEAVDSLTMNFGIPADLVGSIDDAATIMHAMNANTLSAIACHFVDGTDLDAAAEAIKAELSGRQWICGSPDKFVVAKVPGNYLVVVFGVNDVAGPFISSMSAHVMGCDIVIDEPLV